MLLERFNFDNMKVPCLNCGTMTSSGTLDRDGEAFKAYYCDPCEKYLRLWTTFKATEAK